jgi:uncharacterized protein (TIGR02145 family)
MLLWLASVVASGGFYDLGYYTYFWSFTEHGIYDAFYLYLSLDVRSIGINSYVKGLEFSVRCAKDSI